MADGDGDLRDILGPVKGGGPQVNVCVDVSQGSGRVLALVVATRVSAGVQFKSSEDHVGFFSSS